jgi:hypothetical protein
VQFYHLQDGRNRLELLIWLGLQKNVAAKLAAPIKQFEFSDHSRCSNTHDYAVGEHFLDRLVFPVEL